MIYQKAIAELKQLTAKPNQDFAELADYFLNRLLSFDESAVHIYGEIMSCRRALGKPFSMPDAQIAAIALSHKAATATRNVRDFANCSIDLTNPFG